MIITICAKRMLKHKIFYFVYKIKRKLLTLIICQWLDMLIIQMRSNEILLLLKGTLRLLAILLKIAEMCNLEIDLGQVQLPHFDGTNWL